MDIVETPRTWLKSQSWSLPFQDTFKSVRHIIASRVSVLNADAIMSRRDSSHHQVDVATIGQTAIQAMPRFFMSLNGNGARTATAMTSQAMLPRAPVTVPDAKALLMFTR